MTKRRARHVQRCITLAIALGGYLLTLLARPALPDLAAPVAGYRYFPFVAKPVPTATPTPTATPLPPVLQVRVDRSCSSFQGGSRDDPNGEYVCFKNHDHRAADMTNWYVHDLGQHTYIFPPFVLSPGAIVRLHSGPGSNTASELHWARGLIWNNDHDEVYLYDAFGRPVDHHIY